MDLSQDQIAEFSANGFLVLPNIISRQSLLLARAAFWRMYDKCATGSYTRVRSSIYYPKDILGIENIFRPEIFEPDLFAALLQSRVLERSQQLLGQKNVYVQLNRLICTVWRSYNGTWHRDLGPHKEYHVQSALALFPESGFFLIPGSHKISDSDLGLDAAEYLKCRASLPGEMRVAVPAGSLMLFHSAVLHRGTCAGTGKYLRAQVHLRIAKLQAASELSRCDVEGFENPQVQKQATAEWRDALNHSQLSPPTRWVSTPEPAQLIGTRYALKRAAHSILYHATPVLGSLLPPNYPYRRLFVPKALHGIYDDQPSAK